MTWQKYKQLKKYLEKVFAKVEQEAFENGVDITSLEYLDSLDIIKRQILDGAKVNIAEFNEMEDGERVQKKEALRGDTGKSGESIKGEQGERGQSGIDGKGVKGDIGKMGPMGIGIRGEAGPKGDIGEVDYSRLNFVENEIDKNLIKY